MDTGDIILRIHFNYLLYLMTQVIELAKGLLIETVIPDEQPPGPNPDYQVGRQQHNWDGSNLRH